MDRIFAITTTAATIPLTNGQGAVAFTITNNSDRSLQGQVKIRPQTPTDQSWLTLAQDTFLDFPKNATHNTTVQVKVSPGTAPGKYTFRIDVVSTAKPDEDFTEGPLVAFDVQSSKPPPKTFPWWILALAAVVLAVGGIFTWLIFFRSIAVPDVTGKRVEEAARELDNRGFTHTESQVKSSNPEQAGKVISQNPLPGTEVAPGSAVNINLSVAIASTTSPGDKFIGTWPNADLNNRGNTRMEIVKRGEQFFIHTWGSCSPTECDWGEQQLFVDGNTAQVTWDQGFVLRKMVITLEASNQLKVVTDSVYNDDRPRRQSTEMFNKT
jgi:hypothetical protein